MVLNPSAKILCACQGDCNSLAVPKGFRGCSEIECCDRPYPECDPPHVDHGCSYPPTQLGEALNAQLRRGVPTHNEIIVDPLDVAKHLPEVVSAFFFIFVESEDVTRQAHKEFLSTYQLSEDECPLYFLDLLGEGDPFRPDFRS